MPFREKSAWVTFVLLAIGFVVYFSNAYGVLHGATHVEASGGAWLFPLFLFLVLGFIVVEIIAHVILALHSPKEANAPQDEREKLIELKATQPAFYVLLVGAFLSIGTLHFG